MTVPAFEYLGADEGRAPRRGAMVAGALIAAFALLVGLALWGNDHVRSAANEDLVTAFRTANERADAGERLVISTLAYASPMIWSSQVGEDVRAGLRALVQGSAAQVVADLDEVRDQVAGIRVLPWQPAQERARGSLLALIAEQRQRFAGIARDARDIDLVLAGGPIPTGAAANALRAAGAQ